jgi:hypothetical protein
MCPTPAAQLAQFGVVTTAVAFNSMSQGYASMTVAKETVRLFGARLLLCVLTPSVHLVSPLCAVGVWLCQCVLVMLVVVCPHRPPFPLRTVAGCVHDYDLHCACATT